MTWRPTTSPAAEISYPSGRKTVASSLWLEGSLAAAATLAPVIPMFPEIAFPRFTRRRAARTKS